MRGFWLGLLCLAGCTNDGPFVALIPSLPSETSLVALLFLDDAARIFDATGLVSTEEARRLDVPASAEDAKSIILVAYDDEILSPDLLPSADQLRTASLRSAASGEPYLPAPTFAARGAFEDASSLDEVASVPRLWTSWLSPCAVDACGRFNFGSPILVSVPGERDEVLRETIGASDHSEVILAGTSTGTFVYRFRPPNIVEVVAGPIEGVRPRAIHPLNDGQIMLLREDGRLWLGDLDEGLSEKVDVPISIEMVNVTAAREGPALELYAQDENSNVYVLDGDAWRQIFTLADVRSSNQWVEWIGPRELLMLADDGARIVLGRDERIAQGQSFVGGRTILQVEGLGIVISGGQALSPVEPGLHRWTPDGLEALPIPDTSRSPEGMWRGPGRGEVFYGGANGELHFYSHGLGGCQMPNWSAEAIRSATWTTEGLLLAPRRADGQEGEATLAFVPLEEPPLLRCEDRYRVER